MLQVQDANGRIVTSGHFRNEFDRLDPDVVRALTTTKGATLVRARAPEGAFLALARVDSIFFANRRFDLVGGVTVDSACASWACSALSFRTCTERTADFASPPPCSACQRIKNFPVRKPPVSSQLATPGSRAAITYVYAPSAPRRACVLLRLPLASM